MTLVAAILGVGTALALPGLDQQHVGLILAGINAVGAAVISIRVRPFMPAALQGLLTALGALVAGYGLHVQTGTLTALNVLMLAVVGVLTHSQVSPVSGPVAQPVEDDKKASSPAPADESPADSQSVHIPQPPVSP